MFSAQTKERLPGGLYERSFKFSPEVQSTVTEASEGYRARSRERYDAAKLSESETIIKQGMESLDTSNEQLLKTLETHQSDMNTALETYLSDVQAHLTQDLKQLAEQTETMIEDYTQHIAQLIQEREDRIAQIIKSEMKNWAIVTSLIALIILVLGLFIGALVVKKFSKPTYIIQQPQTQQPINYGRQR